MNIIDEIMVNQFYIEIHSAKRLVQLLNEIEGIVKILKVNDTIKNAITDDLKEIKTILQQSNLKEMKDEANKSS